MKTLAVALVLTVIQLAGISKVQASDNGGLGLCIEILSPPELPNGNFGVKLLAPVGHVLTVGDLIKAEVYHLFASETPVVEKDITFVSDADKGPLSDCSFSD